MIPGKEMDQTSVVDNTCVLKRTHNAPETTVACQDAKGWPVGESVEPKCETQQYC